MSRSKSGHLRHVLRTLAAAELLPNRVRPAVLRRAGTVIEDQVKIFGGTTVSGEGDLRIGAHTFLNHQCYLDCAADIVIGAGVAVGPRVQLLTSTHDIGGPEQRAGERRALAITLGTGCWLGAGVIVVAGVQIGAGCVIGAGSVVLHDTEPNTLYAGAPARLVRRLVEADSRQLIDTSRRLRAAT